MGKSSRSFRLSPNPGKDHPIRVILWGIGVLLLVLIGGYMGYSWAINNAPYTLVSGAQALQQDNLSFPSLAPSREGSVYKLSQ